MASQPPPPYCLAQQTAWDFWYLSEKTWPFTPFPTSDFPVLCVRFHLDPQSPVCTDLSMFPKWMCYYLPVLFLFLVNMASYYFLPWGLCRSLFQNEHLAGSAGDSATQHCSSDCLLSMVQIPRQPCHLLPNLTWPATDCFTPQCCRWLLSLVSVCSSSSYAVNC